MIEQFVKEVPIELLNESGSVFYSGRDAFSGEKELYILGINPGGDPEKLSNETIELSIRDILENTPNNWSAYRDESWNNAEPGTWGMQPRILHLFKKLDLCPGEIPASNIVFVRSRRENKIQNIKQISEACWKFHAAVLDALKPKVILCLGKTTGNYVCSKLNVSERIDEFEERNNRHWCSRAYQNKEGQIVIVATHPSIADWTVAATDPSEMIKRVINGSA